MIWRKTEHFNLVYHSRNMKINTLATLFLMKRLLIWFGKTDSIEEQFGWLGGLFIMAKLWYENWAQNRNEALPIGNGRLGGMIYGNPFCDSVALNEETLWSGGPEGPVEPYDMAVIEKSRQLLAKRRCGRLQDPYR